MRGGKKTIQPRDVLDAVKELEFEAFLPRLEAELQSTLTIPPSTIFPAGKLTLRRIQRDTMREAQLLPQKSPRSSKGESEPQRPRRLGGLSSC